MRRENALRCRGSEVRVGWLVRDLWWGHSDGRLPPEVNRNPQRWASDSDRELRLWCFLFSLFKSASRMPLSAPSFITTAVREPPALYFTPHVSRPHKPLRLLAPPRPSNGGRQSYCRGRPRPQVTGGHAFLGSLTISQSEAGGGRVGGWGRGQGVKGAPP